jgi:hypothetical protein
MTKCYESEKRNKRAANKSKHKGERVGVFISAKMRLLRQ